MTKTWRQFFGVSMVSMWSAPLSRDRPAALSD